MVSRTQWFTCSFSIEWCDISSRYCLVMNVFHMRCLRRILGITWHDRVTNKVVLEKAGIPSLYTLLKQRRMRWLGHVTRMEDGRIPKDLLYGELATRKRPTGWPQLRFKDVCKRDLQALDINTDSWEITATDRDAETHSKSGVITIWRNTVSKSGREKAS